MSSDDLRLVQNGYVFIVTMCRPPENFIDEVVVASLADTFEALDDRPDCRAIVLAAEGKHFCAGTDLASRMMPANGGRRHIYEEARRLARTHKPIVAAIQGAAVGAGLGLALLADFRIGCEATRLSANFNRQGFFPGFGLTLTLPRLVGRQRAAWLFYSGQRVKGDEALELGLIDRYVPQEALMEAALAMADDIATSGPLAVQATRALLRADLDSDLEAAIRQEIRRQDELRGTQDFREGVQAMRQRRTPRFQGC